MPSTRAGPLIGHIACRRHIRAGREGAVGVRQHQRVLVFRLLEKVEDALVFHQARDEVEIGLAVLHAVLPRIVRALQVEPVVGIAAVAEDLLDDVGDRLVLKNAGVVEVSQEREPGHQLQLIGRLAVFAVFEQLDSVDQRVDMAFRLVVQLEGQHRRLHQQTLHVDVRIVGERLDVEPVRPGDALVAGEAFDQKGVVPERSLQTKWTVGLCCRHGVSTYISLRVSE